MTCLKTFLADRAGATAIEYGLIAGGIALVLSAAIYVLGGQVSDSLIIIADTIAGV